MRRSIPALPLLVLAAALPTRAFALAELPGENLSATLEEIRADADVPGLVALAWQEGEVVAWGNAGVRRLGGDEPLSIDDPMHLGSCSKAITGTLVARLVEDGVLSWDTTLAEALPELAERIDAGYRGVTPLTLLRHAAGIAERRRPEMQAFFEPMATREGSGPEVRRWILEQVLALPPSPSAPGTYDYSNYGYMTVGLMLQGVTDEPWETLIAERVFASMGLASAAVGSPVGEHVPVGHEELEGGGWRALDPGPGGALPDAMAPAGLTHMALADWATFVGDQMAGHRGEEGFLSPESYARLHDPTGTGYAAGWVVSRHVWSWGDALVLLHNGSDSTWYSEVFAMPEWDLVVLVASNAAGPGSAACERARNALLKQLGFRD